MFASEVNLNDLLKGYRQEEASDLFQITSEQYVTDRDANKRGTANPSVMNNPFWLFQIRPGGLPAWKARTDFGNAEDPFADSEDPVWSFIRFGATGSKLPDGRVVCIGGEHEDGYDPDFCIYNDVVVFDAPPDNDPPPLLVPECIKIYGYPVEVFPPTDFHTSTFYTDPKTGKEFIFIIGGLGYSGQASRNRTDVYQLDLSDFSIHRQKTSGAGPAGGMSRHKAELLDEHGQPVIRITAEEVKEYVVKEERKESTATEEGEAPMATGKIQVPVSTEENEGSSTTTQEGKELVTIEESKMFTLRIGDMRWI